MPPDSSPLIPFARIAGLRVLAWSGNWLYGSKRYDVVRARVQSSGQSFAWEKIGSFRPNWKRNFSVRNPLSARLFRDSFHAVVVLPSGALVGAVPRAIVTLDPLTSEFRTTHVITRGTRPLHIAAVPTGTLYWGEYFDNAARDEVHIYASLDQGRTWNIAYTFPKRAIRHIHNIVYDPSQDCLWILTGDYGEECRILRAPCDLSHIDVVLRGNQQARAVAAVPTEAGLYFASDSPLESNFIYRLDRNEKLSQITSISSSSIYGCRVGSHLFFSTMIEPSGVNRDRSVRIYGADIAKQNEWHSLLNWQKDIWPMRFFQYGNAFLPDGNNDTRFLAVTTAAVKSEDAVTSIYSVT